MLEWRLKAYERWLTMEEPSWARVDYPKIDFGCVLRSPKESDRPEIAG